MSALKARVESSEEDAKNIPDLIKTEFRLTNSQMARLSSDVVRLSSEVAELRGLPAQVEALPRAVAELVVELLADRQRKN